MNNMARLAALCASGLALVTGAANADYTLHILHMNDWHSRIEAINGFGGTCSHDEDMAGKCFGGAARLVSTVAARRNELSDANLILLNAGDNFQGSLFYTTYKGDVEAEFLNLMQVDAMAVGNHEFVDGETGLAGFIDKAEFPVIAANVLPSVRSQLAGRIKPSIVLEIGGQRIGIVGAVANDTGIISEPGDEILIENDVASVTAAVETLRAEGVNKIIALTHVGYRRDMEAIAAIPGIDVIVGGHSHTLLHDSEDGAAGPYPSWAENPEGYRVPIVHAGAYSRYLGELKVTFNDGGTVLEATGEPILLDDSVTQDADILARIDELHGPVEAAKAQRVSETTAPIDGRPEACRVRECELGNLVADAILDRFRGQGVEIVIVNGGALRLSIDSGEITFGEIVEALPFGNTVSTFDLSGRDVIAALENGAAEIEAGGGRFPQVAGIRYALDPSKPPYGGRVLQVEVRGENGWAPIDADRTYRVATNNFLRAGGDGYAVFRDNALNAYDFGPGVEEVVAEYLAANEPYQPQLDGRISQGKMSAANAAPSAGADQEAPAETDGSAQEGQVQERRIHLVARGDTLWDLAFRYYGSGAEWRRIAEANRGIRPHWLRIGQELAIPPFASD